MAEDRRNGKGRAIRLDYQFDRLLAEKLAQAYELLVPERSSLADNAQKHCREAMNLENISDLRTSFIRPAAGEPHGR